MLLLCSGQVMIGHFHYGLIKDPALISFNVAFKTCVIVHIFPEKKSKKKKEKKK